VADCCTPDCGTFFNKRIAEHDAKRYRKRGLTGTARELVELAGEVGGETVLDVGGGIGGIEIALLKAGAVHATSVELSPQYEETAQALLTELGLDDRVTRVIGDFVVEADAIEPHDVVAMHRVVCCYPDVDSLVRVAATHARRRLVLTFPQRRRIVRIGLALVNVFLALRGGSFRVYVHRFERIAAAAAADGLTVESRIRNGLLWESASFVR
jgi:2-polyprenyl-3-methyl-5-hydroxy-6-metoxy-1,4-benzoquinol methylase